MYFKVLVQSLPQRMAVNSRSPNKERSMKNGCVLPIVAAGTLGQIIPPSIVLIILADQLASATDQASTMRKALHKDSTGELSRPTTSAPDSAI